MSRPVKLGLRFLAIVALLAVAGVTFSPGMSRSYLRISSATRDHISFIKPPNGWRFAQGHEIRIELAQDDDPFLKASSVPSSLTLTGVDLAIPVR